MALREFIILVGACLIFDSGDFARLRRFSYFLIMRFSLHTNFPHFLVNVTIPILKVPKDLITFFREKHPRQSLKKAKNYRDIFKRGRSTVQMTESTGHFLIQTRIMTRIRILYSTGKASYSDFADQRNSFSFFEAVNLGSKSVER